MGNLNVDQLHKGWTKLHTGGSSASRKNLHNTMLKRGGAIGDAYKTFIAKNPHLDPSKGVSVKQATKAQVTDKVKAAAREKLASKAYGATKGTKVGGEYGSGELRDTVVPLSKDQHDKVKAAERAAKVPAAVSPKKKPEAKPAAMPAPKKPLSAAERIAAIAKAVRKQKSKFDVPTNNPDDTDHDDLADVHRSLHISGKSSQFDEEKEPRNEREANEKMKPMQSKETQRLLHLAKIAATAKYRAPKKQGVAEGSNDTVYPNAKVIKSKSGKSIGEIYQDKAGWGAFHYKSDNGADSMRSKEEALEHLKDMHNEYRQQRLAEEAEQIDEGDAADLFGKIPPRHLQNIRDMDKGSMTGGKNKMETRLKYLKALHAHQRKYGIDTLKTKEQIEKINRTLVQIGEEVEQDETMEKVEMAQTQLHFIAYAADEILEYIEKDGEIEEWYQNKLSKVHSDMESLFSYVEGEKRRTGMVAENSPGWMIKASPLLAAAAKQMKAKQKQERAIANSPPSKPAEEAPFAGPYSDRIQSSRSRVKKLARSAMNAAIEAKKGKVSEAMTRVVNRKFKNHVNTDPKLMEPSDKEVVGSDKKGMSRAEKINIGKYAQRT
jgi:hypothetical protein